MSPFSIASSLFSLLRGIPSGTNTPANASSGVTIGSAGDFSSALRAASLKAQSVNSLLGSIDGGSPVSSLLGGTGATNSTSSDAFSLLGLPPTTPGVSASSRNLSLFDPESAYKMMSIINNKDARYKAQFSELSAMGTAVAGMQQAGQALAGTAMTMDDATIKAQLQSFTDKYNGWITRFEPTVQGNGVLADTQAAQVSLSELEASVKDRFNGASDGIHGLKDIGFSIDPSTHLASLDVNQLDAALTANRQGVVNTVEAFSANFAKSAELLDSANNFIPNRLANLDGAIHYIDANTPALQA
jgi:flagellar capping protein FliD